MSAPVWTSQTPEPTWENDDECHCGQPIAYGFDGDMSHHRGMCAHCDSVRCDAYPGECRR